MPRSDIHAPSRCNDLCTPTSPLPRTAFLRCHTCDCRYIVSLIAKNREVILPLVFGAMQVIVCSPRPSIHCCVPSSCLDLLWSCCPWCSNEVLFILPIFPLSYRQLWHSELNCWTDKFEQALEQHGAWLDLQRAETFHGDGQQAVGGMQVLQWTGPDRTRFLITEVSAAKSMRLSKTH